jgi:hypothetical protein
VFIEKPGLTESVDGVKWEIELQITLAILIASIHDLFVPVQRGRFIYLPSDFIAEFDGMVIQNLLAVNIVYILAVPNRLQIPRKSFFFEFGDPVIHVEMFH